MDWIEYDDLHAYWIAVNGGRDPVAAYRRYVKEAIGKPENPLAEALRGWVLGSEAFLKRMVVLAQADDDRQRQRTSRRMKALSAEQIIEETAAYYDVDPSEYVGFRSQAAGREMAALRCRRWTGESLSSLSEKFGLAHPDSSSNLIRRARKRSDQSKEYRKAIEDIEWNLGLKTEHQT